MGWLVTVLLLVWLLPLAAAAVAGLVYLVSGTFRGWIERVLFGERLPHQRRAGAWAQHVVRAARR